MTMDKLSTFIKDFWNDEDGIETIEILLILSVLIIIAIMFRDKVTEWVGNLFENIDNELM